MSEYETYPGFPEIRKDIQYRLYCPTYEIWQSWYRLYKNFPNVIVVMGKPPEEAEEVLVLGELPEEGEEDE